MGETGCGESWVLLWWAGPCSVNQIPYDYTVEVTNRVKGLDLIDRVPEELCMEFSNTIESSD